MESKMKLHLASPLSLVVFVTTAALGFQSGTRVDEPVENKKPRMLMVSQSKGWVHQSVDRKGELISPAEKAMRKLAHDTGLFEVDFSQDAASHLTKENLQNYDIVAFYTSGDLPVKDEDLKYFLGDWVKQTGHGFLGFHSASDTFKEHEPYWDFVGGTFTGHPWTKDMKVTMTVHEPNHPTMKPFGAELVIAEEIYQYKNWQPEKVRVLMSIDMAKTELKRPYHVPVAWVKQVGEGKLYYNNLGHNQSTWENKAFLSSIEAAIRWTQGMEKGEATPNPVSQKHDELSVEAAHTAGVTLESVAAEERAKEARKRANQARKKAREAKEKAASGK
jgi:type 1 glutamine amidotransferase